MFNTLIDSTCIARPRLLGLDCHVLMRNDSGEKINDHFSGLFKRFLKLWAILGGILHYSINEN